MKEWKLDRRSPTGIIVLEPDGNIVAFGSGLTGDALVRLLRDSLTTLAPLPPPRDVAPVPQNPDRGVGVRADGSLRLAVAARPLTAAPVGRRPNKPFPPMLDDAYLTRDQAKALAPSRTTVGWRYTLAEDVSRQFAPALSSDGDAFYRMRPVDATVAQLSGEVIAVSDGRVAVRVRGILNGRRSFGNAGSMETNAAVSGLLVFSSKCELQSLTLVCEGQYANSRSHAKSTIGGLVEWRATASDKPKAN